MPRSESQPERLPQAASPCEAALDNRSSLTNYRGKLKASCQQGLHKGWVGFVWMLKILVPISFLTALLQWSGWLGRLDFVIQPAMSLLGLPAMAALPLIIGMLTSVYGGIAAMLVLPFTREQMTLMAIFLLIAHNLIQEGVIQGQSGLHPLKATIFRLVAAFVTVAVAAQFLDTGAGASVARGNGPLLPSVSFASAMRDWAVAMLHLAVKIFFIIMGIMLLLETLKVFGWIKHIVRVLQPLLKALGLSPRVGMLWMTAVVFGLSYGAAVIVEEAGRGNLSREELEELQLSIGINHSMVEDPSLFLSLGLSAFWMWVPRLVTAIVAVRLLTLWQGLRKRRAVQ